MSNSVVTGLFRLLVQRAGGVDAVAAAMEAAGLPGHKGTVSKMCAGHLGVSVDAAMVVQSYVGVSPITAHMQAVGRDLVAGESICDLAEQSTLAAGEAHASLVRALSHRGDGGCAVTKAEASDIIVKARALMDYSARIIAEAEAVMAGDA